MKYRELAKRLRKLGCEYLRPGHGSHRISWKSQNGQYTTIPDWGDRDLKPGTLRTILRDLDIDPKEL